MSSNTTKTTSTLRTLLQNVVAAFQVFRAYPILMPVALLMLVGETNFSGINNVTIPSYLQNLSLSAATKVWLVGVVASTFLLAETIFRMPCGWLSDRLGRTRVITTAMVLTGPSFLLTALLTHYQWLFVLRAWDGLMAAAIFTSIYALIGDAVPERLRANAMGVVNAMYMVGLLAGYVAAGTIDAVTGAPRHFLFFSAALAVVAGILSGIYLERNRRFTAPHPEVHLEDAEKAVVSAARHAVLLSVTFAQNLALTIIAPLMYLYTVKKGVGGLELSLPQLGLLAGLPLLGIAIFAIPLSRVADRIGKLTAVRIAFTAVAATLWIFAVTRELWLLSVAITVVGVAFSMGIPAWLAIISALAGRKTRGVTLGAYGAMQGLASVLGPLVGSLVRAHYGLREIFVASAIMVAIAAILVWIALPEPGCRVDRARR